MHLGQRGLKFEMPDTMSFGQAIGRKIQATKRSSSVLTRRIESFCGCIIALMIKHIIAALVGLSLTTLVFAQSPSLFFKEVWTINGAAHAIAPGENVLTNVNLELKLYGPSAAAADPDKRIWISTPPTNIWTGMTTTPFAATLRDKENYVDLTGMAKVRWITRASGFHVVHPVVKLADGNYYVGEHGDANTSGFLESEFMFATQRWMKLDIERIVTKGTYGPAQDAAAWIREPIDLSKVDEVGFADLIPGSGHGAGGYVNVASFEVYGKPVKRH
jgi:hypothetical protein